MGLDIKKALTTSSGVVLIPKEIDPLLVDIAFKETPLLKLFKEKQWSTNVYYWNERTNLVASGAYDESDAFSSSNSTYSQKNITIKMVKSDGEVSNLLRATSVDYIDALKAEIESATQEMSHSLEKLYIIGNVATNAKEFDGLCNLVTQTYDAASTKISLDVLDGAINKVIENNGKPNLIVLATRDVHELWNSVRSTTLAYFWKEIEVKENYLASYRGIPIVGSQFMPTSNGLLANQSIGFVLDTNQIVVPVVKGLTYEDMTSKVSTDTTAFRIKTYRALAVKAAGSKHAKIINIAHP
jgi:hypothetical protein